MLNDDVTNGSSTNGFSMDRVPECVLETCYEYRGVIVPRFITARCQRQLETMETRPDDIFLVTYPKSGTTWVSQLALLIQFEGDYSKFEGTHVRALVPFVQIAVGYSLSETAKTEIERAEDLPSPRILKTHSRTEWLPEVARSDDPTVKVIYVARNPKDTAISCYFFYKFWDGTPSYETWDIFFEELMANRLPLGSWFEHVLPWWRRRNHPNVLFIKYEDLKRDLSGEVRKIARFMGKSLSNDVVTKIADLSTFAAMKRSKFSNPDVLGRHDKNTDPNASFLRKGKVGDWKNYFTEAQNERFDALYRQQMEGSGLEFQFELP